MEEAGNQSLPAAIAIVDHAGERGGEGADELDERAHCINARCARRNSDADDGAETAKFTSGHALAGHELRGYTQSCVRPIRARVHARVRGCSGHDTSSALLGGRKRVRRRRQTRQGGKRPLSTQQSFFLNKNKEEADTHIRRKGETERIKGAIRIGANRVNGWVCSRLGRRACVLRLRAVCSCKGCPSRPDDKGET